MSREIIAALLREQAAFHAAGDTDGVAEVDVSLAHYGHVHEKAVPAVKETPEAGPVLEKAVPAPKETR